MKKNKKISKKLRYIVRTDYFEKKTMRYNDNGESENTGKGDTIICC